MRVIVVMVIVEDWQRGDGHSLFLSLSVCASVLGGGGGLVLRNTLVVEMAQRLFKRTKLFHSLTLSLTRQLFLLANEMGGGNTQIFFLCGVVNK